MLPVGFLFRGPKSFSLSEISFSQNSSSVYRLNKDESTIQPDPIQRTNQN